MECVGSKYDVNENSCLFLIVPKMQLVAQFKQHMNMPVVCQFHG
jgi:hypothetical protein